MVDNQLLEHVQRLNELERQKHELRKQFALNRIRELRRLQREQQERKLNARDVISK